MGSSRQKHHVRVIHFLSVKAPQQPFLAALKLNCSVRSPGRAAQRGARCENWHVDAFMPPSCSLQGAPEKCHRVFLSPSRARSCHTPGCCSQTAFLSSLSVSVGLVRRGYLHRSFCLNSTFISESFAEFTKTTGACFWISNVYSDPDSNPNAN